MRASDTESRHERAYDRGECGESDGDQRGGGVDAHFGEPGDFRRAGGDEGPDRDPGGGDA
jgi:hypothetical protein